MSKSKSIKSLFILGFWFAASLTPALAEGPTGTILGTLVDEEKGWPIRGATVFLLGATEEIQTRSDFSGKFSFTVPAGVYSGIGVLRSGGEEVFLIEAPLPVQAGVEDDLSEVAIPRPVTLPSETKPFATQPVPDTPPVAPPGAEAAKLPAGAGSSGEGAARVPQAPSLGQQPPMPRPPEETRAWLGVRMRDVVLQSDPNGQPTGNTVVRIEKVIQGSPAERALMREGDILVTIDGQRLEKGQDLQRLLRDYRTGMRARFLLMRDGAFLETVVTLEEITDSMMQALRPPPDPATPAGSAPAGPQPLAGAPQNLPPQNQPLQGAAGQLGGQPAPPLILKARQLSAEGRYLQASEKYDEYLRQFPNDGRAAAEQAQMVYVHIQNARGMALMAQAVKKQGLTVPEKTFLRLIIAHRRFESGNLFTSKQMLIEALREDPKNPDVNGLLDKIYQIEAHARTQQIPLGPGHPRTELEIHLEKEFAEVLEDLFD